MAESDALDRIRNKRDRPTVSPRDTSLSNSNSLSNESNQTKPRTIRLDSSISDRIADVCYQNKISKEVFIESLFEYYESNLQVQDWIIDNAKIKSSARQNLANTRRAKSMMKKFAVEEP